MAVECEVEGCDRPVHSAIHCGAHHDRLKRFGDVRADVPVRRYGPRPAAEVTAAVNAEAYAPTPEPGRGFLWLV